MANIKFKIKKGEQVKIIAGNDKGKVGEVLKVMPKKSQVIVKGCKIAKKAIKPTDENKKGGFNSIEMPIHISNIKKVEE
jgi:large subunit ribosomal protein L24